MTATDTNLDSILVQLGQFGKYQTFILTLFSIAVVLHSAVHVAFVFTARDLDYRCQIPECDAGQTIYEPQWLPNAVPYEDNKPAKCDKYRKLDASGNCSINDFNQNIIDTCDDDFVFDTDEVTILNDFELYCDDNLWKLTLIGTINTIGQFVGLPIGGILADRYGRRNVLIIGMVFCGIFGIIRAFSTNYIMFCVFEFLDAAFGGTTYACGFTLGVELVGPSKRILSGTIMCCTYAIGEILVAAAAWGLQDWRKLILAMYIPPLFLISYFWLTPESIRWLLSRGRVSEAQQILRKAAKINKKVITEEALNKLQSDKETDEKKDPLILVFKSIPLLGRFINCCFCWITCTFLFYGLTLNSVALAGNPYVDFILSALVEIPAYFITYLTVDRWGRRTSQCVWFLLTGITCLAFIFLDQQSHALQLTIYLVGKFGATAAFTVMYVITSEIFPTPLRQSLMGACSMFGRIGSMVAPQMPLLEKIWKPLPLLLFGAMGTIAGLLSLLFPETLNTKLPDTIEEAENIGKRVQTKIP